MMVAVGRSDYELVVKRSRFLAAGRPVESRREAEEIVRSLRTHHADANHVVYAFVIGDAQTELLGMSDDGEPHGTAGRPVLEVLRGSGVRNCLVTVVRYFGGTKLGTGGLVHAYAGAAKGCLAEIATAEVRDLRTASFSCPYPLHDQVRAACAENGAEITQEDFSDVVSITVAVEFDRIDELARRIRDVSRGTISVELVEDR